MPYQYSGIGKDWNHWGDVLPEDREAWQRMAEEQIRPAQIWDRHRWPDGITLRNGMSIPNVTYVLYEVPHVLGTPNEEELHRCYLHALQRVTESEEWVYAFAAPNKSWLYGYRFWPHRGKVQGYWYASPFPNGSDQYFLAQDFSWGILAYYSQPQWWCCVFGQAIIDAFDADPPLRWRASL